MTTVNTEKIRELMTARGLDVTGLARTAGLSRQGLYRFLHPGYEPFTRGFIAVARALEVTPESLITSNTGMDAHENVLLLLEQAVDGEPRAFELIPATLARLTRSGLKSLADQSEVRHRLLAAAGELSNQFSPNRRIEEFVGLHSSQYKQGQAFFFSHRLMDAERILADTPRAMRKHLVFGAFNIEDFERHLA